MLNSKTQQSPSILDQQKGSQRLKEKIKPKKLAQLDEMTVQAETIHRPKILN